MTNSYSRLFRRVIFYYRRIQRVQGRLWTVHYVIQMCEDTPGSPVPRFTSRRVDAVLSVRYNLRVHFTRNLLE